MAITVGASTITMNSGSVLQDPPGTAPSFLCRAFVNFNGTFGSSPFTNANNGIRASGNVSSITDNGVGLYTVNFTTAMADANYTVSLSSEIGGGLGGFNGVVGSMQTSSVGFAAYTQGGSSRDISIAFVAVFR